MKNIFSSILKKSILIVCFLSGSFIGFSQENNTKTIISQNDIRPDFEIEIINNAPTEKLKKYLESFPANYIVTETWYEKNSVVLPIKDFSQEELTHFKKYMHRFYARTSD